MKKELQIKYQKVLKQSYNKGLISKKKYLKELKWVNLYKNNTYKVCS